MLNFFPIFVELIVTPELSTMFYRVVVPFILQQGKWNEPDYNESESNEDDENNVVDDHHIIQ